MNSDQFRRWLAKHGCTFEPAKGGHMRVACGDRVSFMPQHGSRKELGKGLVHKIKKDLGIEE